jgi:outer membrane lipoprotein carrier protein
MRIILPCVLAAGMAVALAAAPAAQTPAPSAVDLAARLQKRYESIRDFTADFTQNYRGLLQRRAATETGKMLLKKPNRVRFTYESPEKKVFVSDGVLFKSYFQETRAGTETPLPKANESSTALMFLAGHGNLSRDFTPGIVTGAPATEWHLGLVPKSKQTDFDTLTLFLNRTTLALLGFVTTDDQGTNTIRFSNLKENTGLADGAFVYKFPPGTEISR